MQGTGHPNGPKAETSRQAVLVSTWDGINYAIGDPTKEEWLTSERVVNLGENV